MPESLSPPIETPWAVLIVGTPVERAALRALLAEQPGIARVLEAGSVEEARAVLRAEAMQIVFLDLQQLGAEALTLLAAAPAGANIILLTAEHGGLVRALPADPPNHLRKPVQPSALSVALDWVRGRSRQTS